MLFHGIQASPCGDGYVFNRIHDNGVWQLWSVDARGTETLLFTGGGEALGEPSCDRAGARVLFARGELAGCDAYIIDRTTHTLVPITNGHRLTGTAAFSHDERSIIVSRSASNETTQLFELPLDGSPSRQITSGELSSTLPTVSRDGTHLVFTHDGTWFPPVLGTTTKRKLTSDQSNYLYNRPFGRDQIVTERNKGGRSEIELLSTSTGQATSLAEGRRPFVSRDRASIYFTNAVDPHLLDRVAIATKVITHVAWLPGELFCGEDGPDGIHVAVSIADQKLGYRIAHDRLTYEHVEGLVTAAPDGGWRAVTSYDATTNRVSLVPPGRSLDQPSRTLEVQSTYNRWLDAHTLAYCADKCVELDVSTGAVTTIGDGSFLATETDDHQLIDFNWEEGQASMRVITNFGDR
ncbi:MAG TPA: hypothetical protein VFQ65_08165 [Kofleriaceae bacterium]|nr:hypothetical protein [Kofleriaceae bacterium]